MESLRFLFSRYSKKIFRWSRGYLDSLLKCSFRDNLTYRVSTSTKYHIYVKLIRRSIKYKKYIFLGLLLKLRHQYVVPRTLECYSTWRISDPWNDNVHLLTEKYRVSLQPYFLNFVRVEVVVECNRDVESSGKFGKGRWWPVDIVQEHAHGYLQNRRN